MFEKSKEHLPSADRDELVSAFLGVRRAVGLAGLALPFLLYSQARLMPGGSMQPSISEFYHTMMGDVLVGILFSIGVFLIAYVGHNPRRGDKLTDWWVSNVAGVAVIFVAIFPALPVGSDCNAFQPPTVIQGIVAHWCHRIGAIHFVSAAIFFFCMALFCLCLFPKNAKGEVHYFDEAGNTTYLICGALLLFAILGLFVFFLMRDTYMGQSLAKSNFVFWFETLGVLAFAIAWLTKGNIIGGLANLGTSKVEARA
jgi:hypothetical protein